MASKRPESARPPSRPTSGLGMSRTRGALGGAESSHLARTAPAGGAGRMRPASALGIGRESDGARESLRSDSNNENDDGGRRGAQQQRPSSSLGFRSGAAGGTQQDFAKRRPAWGAGNGGQLALQAQIRAKEMYPRPSSAMSSSAGARRPLSGLRVRPESAAALSAAAAAAERSTESGSGTRWSRDVPSQRRGGVGGGGGGGGGGDGGGGGGGRGGGGGGGGGGGAEGGGDSQGVFGGGRDRIGEIPAPLFGASKARRPTSALSIRPQPGGGGDGRPVRPGSALLSGAGTRPNSGMQAQRDGGGGGAGSEGGDSAREFRAGDRPTSALEWRRPRSALSMGTALGGRGRPASAVPKGSTGFSGSALMQPLHPNEELGTGMGTDIGLSGAAAQQLQDRELMRRVELLKDELRLKARGMWVDEEEAHRQQQKREEGSETEMVDGIPRATSSAATVEDSSDEEEVGEDGQKIRKVRLITDLKPHEMAQLESRFKGDDSERGLDQQEFEEVIAEFTGLVGTMGTQLFCKIDANDDGTIVWDEFLSYIVQDAKARLESGKPKPLAALSSEGDGKYVMNLTKDMVGASLLLSRHSLFATYGMVRRELTFWNSDTYEQVGHASVPSLTELRPQQSMTPARAVAPRSMAYLATSQGTLYVSSGTDAVILDYDCRRFKIRRELYMPHAVSALCTTWNPEAPKSGGINLEFNSWLVVGDVEGFITCFDCKHHQQVGKFKPHENGITYPMGSAVGAIAMWPKVGIISCGDDGRICIGDYTFWKLKNYRSDKRLKVVQFAIDVVSEAAKKQKDLELVRDRHSEAEKIKLNLERSFKRRAGLAQSANKNVDFEKAEAELIEAAKILNLREELFKTRSEMAMELLGGKGLSNAARSELMSALDDLDARDEQERMMEAEEDSGGKLDQGNQYPALQTGKPSKSFRAEAVSVLLEDTAVEDVFQRDGWDPVKKQFDHAPDWTAALAKLEVLKSAFQKAEEANAKPMVCSTGVSLTSVAVCESIKLVVVGGADRVVRVWNPFITAAEMSVEELHGHESKIAAVSVIDKYQMAISAGADKTIRVWDLNAFVQLQKFHDPFQHRPIDRFTSLLVDVPKKRVLSFGCKGRVWNIDVRKLGASEIMQREEEDARRAAKTKALKKMARSQEHEDYCEELEDSGWAVVDVQKVARGIEKEYMGKPYVNLPNLKMLTGDRSDEKLPREEVENQKWLELHAMLEKGREVGMGENVVAAHYSPTFDQMIVVGVSNGFVFRMETGEMICKFSVSMGAPVTCACLDSSGRRIITGSHDGGIHVWNFNSGVLMGEFPPQSKEVTSVGCVPNGRFVHRPIVAAGWDRDVITYEDLHDEDEVAEPIHLKGHSGDILCMEVCDRRKTCGESASAALLVCSGDANGKLNVWVASNGRLMATFTSDMLNSDSGASRQQSSGQGDEEGDSSKHGAANRLGPQSSAVRRNSFSSLGRNGSSASGVGAVGNAKEEGEDLSQKDCAIFSLHYMATHDTLLVGLASGHVHAIDLSEKTKFCTVEPDVFPDEPIPGEIDETHTADQLSLQVCPDAPSCIASNHSGTRVFVGESSGAIQMWNIKRRGKLPVFTRVRRFQGHWRSVVNIICSPKSRLFASVGGDGSSRIWTPKGKPVHYCGVGATLKTWPKWADSDYTPDVVEWDDKGRMKVIKQDAAGKMSRTPSSTAGEPTSSTAVPRVTSSAGGESAYGDAPSVPFHILCPPIIPKTLMREDNSSSSLAAMNAKKEEIEREERFAPVDEKEEEKLHPRRHMHLFQALDQLHFEASIEISPQQKAHMAALEKRLNALLVGPPLFPDGVKVSDILPQGNGYSETCQRLEDHCSLIEILNKNRILIKDLFRTYAALSISQIDMLNTIQLDELKSFLKDNRCSQRALAKIGTIFQIANRTNVDEPAEAQQLGSAKLEENPDNGLVLAEFIEVLVRVAREQHPGKDHLPKKLGMFMQNVMRHCKAATQNGTPMMNDTSVAKVVKKHTKKLKQIFGKYSEADKMDGPQGMETMSLKELYAMMKDCAQMDSKFGIPKLASAFITANSVNEQGDDGTWNEWDWELDYEEFLEVIVRIVDMKTKTAEGVLSDKVDTFIGVLAKNLL